MLAYSLNHWSVPRRRRRNSPRAAGPGSTGPTGFPLGATPVDSGDGTEVEVTFSEFELSRGIHRCPQYRLRSPTARPSLRQTPPVRLPPPKPNHGTCIPPSFRSLPCEPEDTRDCRI